MPMRDDASYARPRLYDADDPEKEDDVALILDALDDKKDEAMEEGDSDKVWHASDLKRRIVQSAGADYEDRLDSEKAEAET